MRDTKREELEQLIAKRLLQCKHLKGATIEVIYSEGTTKHTLKVSPSNKAKHHHSD